MQRVSKQHLLVLFGQASSSDERRLTEWLRAQVNESDVARAYQLVDRNRITLAPDKVLKEVQRDTLRPFRFLIGKN